ncbi:Pimeloyl-ACP methyl ester carboxylesterase [Salinihabitans flavidus]|uniref:Pimeloyl-ACP methyl ester carboxylesterase n=1 Tax=Salinihabitans flavidus TaxID=569882 RepID=A0A1H8W945_9RHOB|nr:Pimeloyl-ACP methyl ester carboxylesterase [Salinihabitans flavidus]
MVRVANWFTHLDLDRQSAVWRHWFDFLSDGRTLIRYDPRGSGLSDRNVDDFSMDRWIEDLDAVVKCAGLTRFPLIGLCQGGAVAAAYAARHPNRISRLVLYDSYPFGAYAEGVPDRLVQEARALAEMIEVGWGKKTGAFREIFANLLMPEADKDALRWISEMQRRSASARNARLMWDAFNDFDIRDVAGDIAAPTLVFHGRRDAMVPFEAGRQLASLIPNARFVPLETSNHILLPNENAWAQFCREFNDFLEPEAAAERACGLALDTLTAREAEVLDGVARGLGNRDLADLLRISEKTVRNYVSTVFSKLGVESRAQAIVSARDAGLGRD